MNRRKFLAILGAGAVGTGAASGQETEGMATRRVTPQPRGKPSGLPFHAHFTDVASGHPFYGFIETAYNHGIITGYSDGTFRPDNSATRGQICKIVYQAITQP